MRVNGWYNIAFHKVTSLSLESMGCYNDITATATASALNLAPVVGRVRIIRHLPKSVYVVRTSEDRLSRRVGERASASRYLLVNRKRERKGKTKKEKGG